MTNVNSNGVPNYRQPFFEGKDISSPWYRFFSSLASANVNQIGSGTSALVRVSVNNTPLVDFYADGSIYLHQGGGFGSGGQHITSQGAGQPVKWA